MGRMIGNPWIETYRGKRGATYSVWWRHEADVRTGKTRSHVGPYKTKAEAERTLRQLSGQAAQGRSLSRVRWRTTVGEYIEQSFWEAFVANQDENTRSTRASIIRTHLLPYWGEIRFEWIDNEMVLDFARHIEAKGLAWATNRKILDIFGMVMRRAHLAGGYLPNGLPFDRGIAPLGNVGTAPLDQEATLIFGFDELQEFLSLAEERVAPGYYRLIYTLAYTGMRPGEALDLGPANLHLTARPPKIRAVASKTRRQGIAKVRDIELDRDLVRVLTQQRDEEANERWLWPGKRQPLERHLNDDAFRKKIWIPLVREFGRPELTPYALRHTHASQLLLAGVEKFVVARRLGHSVRMLEKTYAHLLGGEQADALAILRHRGNETLGRTT